MDTPPGKVWCRVCVCARASVRACPSFSRSRSPALSPPPPSPLPLPSPPPRLASAPAKSVPHFTSPPPLPSPSPRLHLTNRPPPPSGCNQVQLSAQLTPYSPTGEARGNPVSYAPATPLRPPPPASYDRFGNTQMAPEYSRFAASSSPGAVAPPPTYNVVAGSPGGAPLRPASGFGHA